LLPNPHFPQFFLLDCFESCLTEPPFFSILCVLSGDFSPSSAATSQVGVVGWKGILQSRNIDRRNGTEERPEWGASPEKPSKPLRFGTKSGTFASWSACGVSCWYLRSRRKPFSTFVCSRAFLCAPREPRQFLRATSGDFASLLVLAIHRRKKRGILCRRFRNLYAWVEKGS
jgi:hypothetical protein